MAAEAQAAQVATLPRLQRRGLAPRAKQGWVELADFSQARIDDMRVVFPT